MRAALLITITFTVVPLVACSHLVKPRWTLDSQESPELLEKAKQKTKLHAGISPVPRGWIGTSAGLPTGISLNYGVRRGDAEVELYIDSDRDTGEGNKKIFGKLHGSKDEIEKSFGGPLNWKALEGKRACGISKKIDIAGWQNEDRWPEAHEAMIEAMIALESSLRPHIKKI